MAQCVRLSRHAFTKVLVTTDDQFQTAYLLQKCVMVRDGLAKLPDCFNVGDMRDIASYVSTC